MSSSRPDRNDPVMMKPRLKVRFLVPVTMMLALLLALLLYFVQRQLAEDIEHSLNDGLIQVNQLFQSETAEDVQTMKLLIQDIMGNRRLAAAMRKQDREALQSISRPMLEDLQSSYDIDHLYLLSPERVTLLRAHQPDRFGDTINRYSAIQAEITGEVSEGVALGPLGTLALRVVAPWFDDGALLGYVELARNAEQLVDDPLVDMHVFITLYKKHLIREGWESGMRIKGVEPDWEQFPSLVLVSQASGDDVKALSGFLSDSGHEHSSFSHEVILKGKHYRTATIPIFESSGLEVGDIVVLTDVTERLAVYHREVRNISLLAIAFSLFLILFSYLILGRIEQRLERTQQKLLDEALKRELLQEKHLEELKATLLETERAEEAALNMMEDAEMAREDLHNSFIESIYTLMRAAEYRDDETGAHVKRISYYTRIIAKQMGMDEAFCEHIFYASAMHDIGKIGISDLILLKPGGFTPEEWTIMKTHAVIGGGILGGNASPYLQMGEQIAIAHHERWDGGGYPFGIKGEAIPLPARIMQLADVYDALRSRRPYKEPFSHERTMQIICEGDGRTDPGHFDPAVLAAFKQCADQMAEIFDQKSEPDEQ